MADIEIGAMEAVFEFEPETVTATPAAAQPAGEVTGAEIARLRALLRPIILELFDEELSLHSRIRG